MQSVLYKNLKKSLFLIPIRYISQKYIIFAAVFKNRTKLQKKFNINK